MERKHKVLITALTAVLIWTPLCLSANAESNSSLKQNSAKEHKLEVHKAPAKNTEPNSHELKTHLDRFADSSWRSLMPWFADSLAWRLIPDLDWWSNRLEGLSMNQDPPGAFWSSSFPRMDSREDDKQIIVSAEVPGIEESKLDVTVSGDTLTIKGEKEDLIQAKDKQKNASERRYGAFERSIKLPCQIDSDKVEASLKNGVLTVLAPKLSKQTAEGKKICIKKES